MSALHVRKACIKAAKSRSVLTYSALAPLLGLDMYMPADRAKIGELLDELARAEHEAGRPLLSAVVVGANGGMPGHGFFKLARSFGLMGPKDVKKAFCWEELQRLYAYWAAHEG
jgi:hypothetical protein